LSVVDDSFGEPLKTEESASLALAGGLMQQGYQCGIVWGAALAAGAQAHRLLGPGPQPEAQAIIVTQRLVDSFRARFNDINCLEITELDWRPSSSNKLGEQALKFLRKGGPILCLRMTARFTQEAFRDLSSAYPGDAGDVPSSPVSCAAMLAQKMGMSGRHPVMVAGLAGGIGLSGGACGALGAAIWIMGMQSLNQGAGQIGYDSPTALAAVDRFLECTDYEFECSEIVGRKFTDVADHACYLREGGCSEIIEALATL
jgi:hypothetical protein